MVMWIRDLFDANTPSDRRKRKARGEPEWYRQQKAQQQANKYILKPSRSTISTSRPSTPAPQQGFWERNVVDKFSANTASDRWKRDQEFAQSQEALSKNVVNQLMGRPTNVINSTIDELLKEQESRYMDSLQEPGQNWIKDLLDSNSAVDQQSRIARGEEQMYRDQQIAMGRKRPMENLGQQILGNTARMTNTGMAAVDEVYDTAALLMAEKTGNVEAWKNINARIKARQQEQYQPNSGLMGAGTIFDNPEEFNTLGATELAKRVGLNTVGTMGEVIPVGVGAKAASLPLRQLGKPLLQGMTAAGVSDAGQQYTETGTINPLQLAAAAVTGGGMTIAPTLAVKGAKAAAPVVADTSKRLANDEAGKVTVGKGETPKDRATAHKPTTNEHGEKVDKVTQDYSDLGFGKINTYTTNLKTGGKMNKYTYEVGGVESKTYQNRGNAVKAARAAQEKLDAVKKLEAEKPKPVETPPAETPKQKQAIKANEAPKKAVTVTKQSPKEKSQRTRQIQRVHVLASQQKLTDKQRRALYKKITGKDSTSKMSVAEREKVIKALDPTAAPTPKKVTVRKPQKPIDGNAILDSTAERMKATKKDLRDSRGARVKDAFERNVINPNNRFARSDRLEAKKQGVKKYDLEASKTLEKLSNDVKNNGAFVLKRAAKKTKTGYSPVDVMRKYDGKKAARFLQYVEAKVDLENRGFKDGKRITKFSKKQLQAIIRDFEKANPDADKHARTLKFAKDDVEMEMMKAGGMTKKEYRAATKSRKYYFPTRAIENEGNVEGKYVGGVRGSNRENTVVQERTGKVIESDKSWDAVVSRMMQDNKEVLETRLFNEMMRRADTGTLGVREVNVKDDLTNRNILYGLVGGEQKALELEHGIAKMLQGANKQDQREIVNAVTQAIATGHKVAYTGFLNPVFHAINLVKNPALLIHNEPITVLNPFALARGVQGAFNAGKFGEKNLSNYGANVIRATQNVAKPKVQAALLEMNPKNPLSVAKFTTKHGWTSIKSVLAAADHMLAFSDRGFRSVAARAAYGRAKKLGKSESEAMEYAAFRYNESLGNFNQVTQAARSLEPLIIYSGAIQAGARSFGRAYRDRPFETLLKDAAFVGAIVGIHEFNDSREAGREFYEDMDESGKSYVYEDNLVFVSSDAYKVTKEMAAQDDSLEEGEWVGVIKIPINPDMRPMNRTITNMLRGKGLSFRDAAGHVTGDMPDTIANWHKDQPIVKETRILANNDPRTGKQIVSDFELNTKETNEQIDEKWTSNFAKGLSGAMGAVNINLSPKQIDAIVDNLGLTGDLLQNREGKGARAIIEESFKKQFIGLKGDKQGSKYYKDLTEVSSTLKNEPDYLLFLQLHTKNDDKGKETSAARAGALLGNENVLKAEIALAKRAKDRGEPTNPLYDLPEQQMKNVLRYRSLRAMDAAKQTYDKDGNTLYDALGLTEKWYDDFRDKESAFYEKILGTDDEEKNFTTFSGAINPKTPELDALSKKFFDLPTGDGPRGGNKTRSLFLQTEEGQKLLNYWADRDDFTNLERTALGLKVYGDAEEEGSFWNSAGFASNDSYGGSGEGGSKSGWKNYSRSGGGGGSSNVRKHYAADYLKKYDVGGGSVNGKAPAPKIKKVTVRKRGTQGKKVTVSRKKIRLA